MNELRDEFTRLQARLDAEINAGLDSMASRTARKMVRLARAVTILERRPR